MIFLFLYALHVLPNIFQESVKGWVDVSKKMASGVDAEARPHPGTWLPGVMDFDLFRHSAKLLPGGGGSARFVWSYFVECFSPFKSGRFEWKVWLSINWAADDRNGRVTVKVVPPRLATASSAPNVIAVSSHSEIYSLWLHQDLHNLLELGQKLIIRRRRNVLDHSRVVSRDGPQRLDSSHGLLMWYSSYSSSQGHDLPKINHLNSRPAVEKPARKISNHCLIMT